MKVVGVDLSLTGTGVAVIVDSTWVELETITSKPGGDLLANRNTRLNAIIVKVLAKCLDADLVVIEGPSLGSKHGQQWDRAGLWWGVVSSLLALEIPVVEVAPTALKKWATGKGTAAKMAVGMAISKVWPDSDIDNDNVADALCLASIALQRMGRTIGPQLREPTKYQHEVLEKLK